jgi:hypothetical protein
MKNKHILIGAILLLSFVIGTPVFASDGGNQGFFGRLFSQVGNLFQGKHKGAMKKPADMGAIMGTVTVVAGNTITISGVNGITYTVDATNAEIMKGGVTTPVSGLVVGDVLMVRGTISGTTVTAKLIADNFPRPDDQDDENDGIKGAVTQITGTTITIQGKNNTIYTVNATSAEVKKDGVVVPITTIVVGDMLRVEGTLSGTTVTATKITVGMSHEEKSDKMKLKDANLGMVTSVSGTSFVVTMRAPEKKTPVTYTVTTSGTTVFKKDGAA